MFKSLNLGTIIHLRSLQYFLEIVIVQVLLSSYVFRYLVAQLLKLYIIVFLFHNEHFKKSIDYNSPANYLNSIVFKINRNIKLCFK